MHSISNAPTNLIELIQGANLQANDKQVFTTRKAPSESAAHRVEGFQTWQAILNDEVGDGRRGFNEPIYRAMCKFFRANGANANVAEFIQYARPLIESAPCQDGRNWDRYSTDEYLDEQLEKARVWTRANLGKTPRSSGSALQQKLDDCEDMDNACQLLSEHYAIAWVGSKVSVVLKPTREDDFRLITPNDFKVLFSSHKFEVEIDGESRSRSLGHHFLESKYCERFERLTFSPGKDAKPGELNLWSGFPIEAEKGDWSLLEDHIREIICKGDNDVAEWLLDWFAQIIQRPEEKLGSAVVVRGGKGVGKSTLFEYASKLMGRYATKVSQKDQLTGKFNNHLANKLLVTVEESVWGGERQTASILKDKITSDRMMLEQKGKDAIPMPDLSRLAFVTNETWAAPIDASGDSRRYLVLEASGARKNDHDYFADMADQMNNGGLEAMMFDLLNRRPIREDWSHLRNPPRTEAFAVQRGQALNEVQNRFIHFLQLGVIEGLNAAEEPFAYALSDDEPTLVSRRHLASLLAPGVDLRGAKGRRLWSDVAMVCGTTVQTVDKQKINFRNQPDSLHRGTGGSTTMDRGLLIPPLNEVASHLLEEFGITLDEG